MPGQAAAAALFSGFGLPRLPLMQHLADSAHAGFIDKKAINRFFFAPALKRCPCLNEFCLGHIADTLKPYFAPPVLQIEEIHVRGDILTSCLSVHFQVFPTLMLKIRPNCSVASMAVDFRWGATVIYGQDRASSQMRG